MNATEEPKAPEMQAAILHKELLRKVIAIKSRRGGSVADIVTQFGGPGIEAEYRRCVSEMQAELGGEG